jgi:hypothetical protein
MCHRDDESATFRWLVLVPHRHTRIRCNDHPLLGLRIAQGTVLLPRHVLASVHAGALIRLGTSRRRAPCSPHTRQADRGRTLMRPRARLAPKRFRGGPQRGGLPAPARSARRPDRPTSPQSRRPGLLQAGYTYESASMLTYRRPAQPTPSHSRPPATNRCRYPDRRSRRTTRGQPASAP